MAAAVFFNLHAIQVLVIQLPTPHQKAYLLSNLDGSWHPRWHSVSSDNEPSELGPRRQSTPRNLGSTCESTAPWNCMLERPCGAITPEPEKVPRIQALSASSFATSHPSNRDVVVSLLSSAPILWVGGGNQKLPSCLSQIADSWAK